MQAEKLNSIREKGSLFILPATVLGFILIFSITPFIMAQSSTVTEQNLKDAVLAKKSFTDAELTAMDQNGDGVVDVADLVVLGVPVADFETGSSEVWEGDETKNVIVNFSSNFVGTLKYLVEGSAVSGNDYEPLSGSIAVNGSSVTIPITIEDDSILDETLDNEGAMVRKVETIILTIYYAEGEGLNYVPGKNIKHTIYVYDNDAIWEGSIGGNGANLQFRMKIIQSSTGQTGSIITDGFGIIPSSPNPITLDGKLLSEWPAISMDASATTFEAVFGNIDIQSDQTHFNKEMQRMFTFHANGQQPNNTVDLRSLISGEVTEEIIVMTEPHLNRQLQGNFLLLKEIPIIEARQPVLTSVTNIN